MTSIVHRKFARRIGSLTLGPLLLCSMSGLFGLLGCEQIEDVSAEQYGQQIFSSLELASSSKRNLYTCSSCHRVDASDREEILLAGADLAGVVARPSFWGGSELNLLRSINACRAYFMRAETEWDASDPRATALYAFLASKTSQDAAAQETRNAQSFTWVNAVSDVPRGDATRGLAVYARACKSCHGEATSGQGRNSDRTTILPSGFFEGHLDVEYTKLQRRLTAIEKIRHGRFFGYGGEMPPFALETLSDSDVSDILEALTIVAE